MGIYAPKEMARVSIARLMWPCTIDQDRGVGRGFISISRGCREGLYKVKQGVKPDNCQDSKFLLGLMARELVLWHQLGNTKVANS